MCEDPEVRTFYVRYMHLCADLHWNNAADDKPEVRNPKSEVSYSRYPPVPNSTYIPPIVLDLSPAVHPSLAATLFTPGGFLFSYAMSALLVGIGLVIVLGVEVSPTSRSFQVAVSRAEREAHCCNGPPASAD